MNKRFVGKTGEDIASTYLQENGYTVICRNFSCHLGEIDIVAKQGGYVVFVEVKNRSTTAFGLPRQAVDWRKQQKIVGVAKFWLVSNKLFGSPVRFDVVEILDGKVTILQDAFRI